MIRAVPSKRTTTATDAVQVTDSLGNTATTTVTVTGSAVMTISPVNPSVPATASQQFTQAGGTPPITWSLTTNNSGGAVSGTGLYTAGPAAVSTTDAIQATDSAGHLASTGISVIAGLTISPQTASVGRSGTQLLTTVSGVAPFIWSIQPNNSGSTLSASSGATVTYTAGTSAGIDTVKVVDNTGFTATAKMTVVSGVTIVPAMTTMDTNAHKTFAAHGGIAPYTFTLSSAPSGGSISASGAYSSGAVIGVTDIIVVTDTIGQSATARVVVDNPLSITYASTNLLSSEADLLTAIGGTPPYTWSIWQNQSGGTLSSTTGASITYTAGSAKGYDGIVVTDSLGRTASFTSSVLGPVSVYPDSVALNVNESFQFSPYAGAPPYSFALSANQSGGSISISGDYTAGPIAGTDSVVVTDSQGGAASATVTLSGIAQNELQISPRAVTVEWARNVTFTATGGSGGYSFAFAPNGANGALNGNVFTANAGYPLTATVVVTDSSGNTATAVVTVVELLFISPQSATVSLGGSQQLFLCGGVPPYHWEFQSNSSGGTVDASGNYTAGRLNNTTDIVEGTDADGDAVSATITVGP